MLSLTRPVTVRNKRLSPKPTLSLGLFWFHQFHRCLALDGKHCSAWSYNHEKRFAYLLKFSSTHSARVINTSLDWLHIFYSLKQISTLSSHEGRTVSWMQSSRMDGQLQLQRCLPERTPEAKAETKYPTEVSWKGSPSHIKDSATKSLNVIINPTMFLKGIKQYLKNDTLQVEFMQ